MKMASTERRKRKEAAQINKSRHASLKGRGRESKANATRCRVNPAIMPCRLLLLRSAGGLLLPSVTAAAAVATGCQQYDELKAAAALSSPSFLPLPASITRMDATKKIGRDRLCDRLTTKSYHEFLHTGARVRLDFELSMGFSKPTSPAHPSSCEFCTTQTYLPSADPAPGHEPTKLHPLPSLRPGLPPSL